MVDIFCGEKARIAGEDENDGTFQDSDMTRLIQST